MPEKISAVNEGERIEYMLLSDIKTDEENNPHSVYGVRVKQTKPNKAAPETAEARDLTFNKERMLAFMEKMARNMASPEILAELAEDFVVEENTVNV